eukprot:1627987-Prymnesium_polylepis.4
MPATDCTRGVSVGRLFLEGYLEVPTRCFKPLAGVLDHHEHRESTFWDAGLPKMGGGNTRQKNHSAEKTTLRSHRGTTLRFAHSQDVGIGIGCGRIAPLRRIVRSARRSPRRVAAAAKALWHPGG